MTATQAERLAWARTLDATAPLAPSPAQFAHLDVAGLRRMYMLTCADPLAACGALRGVTDVVHVLAVVAPHAIPRAQERHDAAQARERAYRERLAADAGRHLARDLARGTSPATTRETDDDGREIGTRASTREQPRARNPGDVVQLSDGRTATVLYTVAGAVVAQCADGAVVSL